LSLRVLELFGISTLQDTGRPGFRRFGVPPGGAFDTESFVLANRILGNPSDACVLEMGLGGGRFAVEEDACLSLVGAEGPGLLNGVSLAPQSSFEVHRGDELEVRAFQRGVSEFLGF
jgi:allophanate hydrolase subunit 2